MTQAFIKVKDRDVIYVDTDSARIEMIVRPNPAVDVQVKAKATDASRPKNRSELVHLLLYQGNGSSMDKLAAGLSVYDYCMDAGGGRNENFMQKVKERFDALLEELHLECVVNDRREPVSLIDGMAKSLHGYLCQQYIENPEDFERDPSPF